MALYGKYSDPDHEVSPDSITSFERENLSRRDMYRLGLIPYPAKRATFVLTPKAKAALTQERNDWMRERVMAAICAGDEYHQAILAAVYVWQRRHNWTQYILDHKE